MVTALHRYCEKKKYWIGKTRKLTVNSVFAVNSAFIYILNWGLCSNIGCCDFFIRSNYLDIFALYETSLANSIDSSNFSVRSYLPLIRKDLVTRMHGLALYVKEELRFASDLSFETSENSYSCFWMAFQLSFSALLFFRCQLPFSSLFTIFNVV